MESEILNNALEDITDQDSDADSQASQERPNLDDIDLKMNTKLVSENRFDDKSSPDRKESLMTKSEWTGDKM